MAFGIKKLEWCGYGKKIEDIFIRFDRVYEHDRLTDTARRHRPRLCIARGKNNLHWVQLL